MSKPTTLTIRTAEGLRLMLPRDGAPHKRIDDAEWQTVPNTAFVRKRIARGEVVEKDGHYMPAAAPPAPTKIAEQPTAPAKASASTNMRARATSATKEQ